MASKEEVPSKQAPKSAPQTDGLDGAAKIVQDAAEKLIQFTRETAGDLNSGVKEKAELVENALAAGVKNTTSLIKKYPLESALVCFGVGVMAGMLLKNRD